MKQKENNTKIKLISIIIIISAIIIIIIIIIIAITGQSCMYCIILFPPNCDAVTVKLVGTWFQELSFVSL